MGNKQYKHVIVVGLDGAGAFIKEADTPNFDRIFAQGAITYSALSVHRTVSAQCWGAMLLGVGPEIHGLTNAYVRSNQYPIDSPNPSLFRRIREAIPDAELGAFCDWSPIINGIVEANANVTTASARDTELTPKICTYIEDHKPTFLFIQMDSIDHVGHRQQYGSPEYMQRIHEVDFLVNDVYEAVGKAGILEDTLFLVIADHGGTNTSHGGWTDTEKFVTFAAIGFNVRNVQIKTMNIRDLAAIVLYALGINRPALDAKGWTSQIPNDLFDDPNLPLYQDIVDLAGAEPHISTIPGMSEPT